MTDTTSDLTPECVLFRLSPAESLAAIELSRLVCDSVLAGVRINTQVAVDRWCRLVGDHLPEALAESLRSRLYWWACSAANPLPEAIADAGRVMDEMTSLERGLTIAMMTMWSER